MLHNIQFKKHFGQNFLRSEEHLENYINVIEPFENDLIIEIGPGDGAVTERLLKKGCKVVSIEVDTDLIPILSEKFEFYTNFTLIQADVLELDLVQLLSNYTDASSIKIVGALPYNISKPIIRNVLELTKQIEIKSINFIIQKEVAEDYTTKPPRAQFLYNMSSLFSVPIYNFTIPKKFFYPEPKVDGGVLTFLPYNKNSIGVEQLLFKFDQSKLQNIAKLMKQAYLNPRKTLSNNLKHLELKLSVYANLGIDLKSRASELKLEQWIDLYRHING
jgi:16S rRNA (adenine1518-N6/adenine1519-N6)-dimethyltransferase